MEAARREKEAQVVSEIAASAELATGDLEGLVRRMTEAAACAPAVERVGVWLAEDQGSRLVCLDNFIGSKNEHTSGAVLLEPEFGNEFEALKSAKYIDAHDALADPRTSGYVEGYLIPNNITSMLDSIIEQPAGRCFV